MPLWMIEETERHQKGFVESWDPVEMSTCLLWCALQVSEEENKSTVRPFHVLFEPRSAQIGPPTSPSIAPAPAAAAGGLIPSSVNQSE